MIMNRMDQLLCGIDDVLCSVLPASRAGCLYMYCIAYCPRSAQMHWMNYYNNNLMMVRYILRDIVGKLANRQLRWRIEPGEEVRRTCESRNSQQNR